MKYGSAKIGHCLAPESNMQGKIHKPVSPLHPLSRFLGKVRFPLHIHIATLFIGLIVAVGLILGWFNYHKNAEIILSASEQLFDQINQEVMTHLRQTVGQTAGSINLLVLTPISHAQTLEERIGNLPLLVAVLRNETSLSAVQAGYANGDYFIVRPLRSTFMQQQFKAPAEAAYMADNIVKGQGAHQRMLRLFFDQKLEEIKRQSLPDTVYDPRQRDWYQRAMAAEDVSVGNPYLYFFIRKVGLTIGQKSPDGNAVVAADITLESLSETLNHHSIAPSAEVMVFDDQGRVLAYRYPEKLIVRKERDSFDIARIDELGSPVLSRIAPRILQKKEQMHFTFEAKKWLGTVRKIDAQKNTPLYLSIVVPEQELLSDAARISRENTLITVLILLLALPLAWLFAHKITRSLRLLSQETQRIRHLDFSGQVTTNSMILEIVELAEGMEVMKDTINKFLRLITSLAGEQDFDRMLRRIAQETLDAGKADAVGVLLLTEDETQLTSAVLEIRENLGADPLLPPVSIGEQKDSLFVRVLESGEISVEDITETAAGIFDSSLLPALQVHHLQIAAFPLKNRSNEVIGVLYAVYGKQQDEAGNSPEQERLSFIDALTGFAAVSLETRLLLKSQKDLLEAFIKLIAGAIDAKSPYTGGHCQRVPELTKMLVEVARRSDAPAFRLFDPSPEDWEAIHIAAWLHDCGKVTTPEYVVDKAAKLETLYNRIHEVRMRFEVLKRDAQIAYWQGLAEGGSRDRLRRQLEVQLSALDDDFSFVAKCNEGSEYLPQESIERLREIAKRRWQRTLDDRIGLSWEELQRKRSSPADRLPITENVLADKPEHLVPRDESARIPAENPWGFKLDVPKYKFNRGELYNLSVQKGTLTAEERYIINDHIVQTIIMLEQLPYPRHLREVPALAGAHHEKMDGSGYPRKLKRNEMPLVARIMAIADIFEAITASDRPYKKPKKLSEAIHIMASMKTDHHIDADLFDLFLSSGVYLRYAEKFLAPEQIDHIDIEKYLS
jgi:HD-GYP domain-containing protein (c-di-GMP phosphodiesterase class II)